MSKSAHRRIVKNKSSKLAKKTMKRHAKNAKVKK